MAGLAYYPGCSLRHSAVEFDTSSRVLMRALGLDLMEIPDWTCCGSSPAHMTDHLLAQALAARNLRQAADAGADEMVAPCPSCWQREKSSAVEIHDSEAFRAEVNEMLDAPYTGNVHVYNILEVLIEKVGLETIAGLVKTDLSELKVVPYYGCLLARPLELLSETNDEQPMQMDQLLAAAGAKVQWWNYKTECCGASVGVPKKEIQQRLTLKLLEQAVAAGADVMVTACPLCHQNLDLRQPQVNAACGTDFSLPIMYLPQVVGMALGFTAEEMLLDKHVVDPAPVVERAIALAAEKKADEARKVAEKAAKAAERSAGKAEQEASAEAAS